MSIFLLIVSAIATLVFATSTVVIVKAGPIMPTAFLMLFASAAMTVAMAVVTLNAAGVF